MNKVCKICKKEKSIFKFCKNKQMKDGYLNICMACKREYDKKWRQENKEKMKEYYKKWYSKNRKKKRKWHQQNKEEINEKSREKYKENKKAFINKSIKWQNKVKDDPYRKFKNRIKASMRRHLKKNGEKTFNLLGYTREEFLNRMKETLPKEYGWKDLLKNSRRFHIDHIIPQCLYVNEEEYIEKCWNLRNLRLITAKENTSRSNKIDMKLIEEYCIEDLLPIFQ